MGLMVLSCNNTVKEKPITNPENEQFPDSWKGTYKGELFITKNGTQTDTNFMTLKIFRLDMERTAFHIKYDSDSSWREYEIKEGKAINHWILDEKNSILLDHYIQNNEFTSIYSVNDFMLKANYKKIGDSIISTITTYPLRFAKITGDSTPYKIKSFKEQQVQRAVLKRMK